MLLKSPNKKRLWRRHQNVLRRIIFLLLCLLLQFCVSCRSGPPLPAANLSSPGWRIQQGQAIWKPDASRPELVGDLLLATHSNGDFLVQFTKIPFALATAQVAEGRWQIAFASGQYVWRGTGEPPKRFGWFELPRVLNGGSPNPGWDFACTNDLWRIRNLLTGETLEGQFFP